MERRHALVCGASKGIGRASALALAKAGHTVTLLARDKTALTKVAAEITKEGAKAHVLAADLDDRRALQDALQAHLAQHGPIEILVNNTGGPPSGPLLDADDAAFLAAFERHVLGAHLLVRLLLPGMRKAAFGRIINILSTSVREPIPGLGVSNLTRAAMASWAKTLSRELPPGVTINSILPGFTDTERLTTLAKQMAKGKSEEAVRADWIEKTPEGRLGRPEELGATVAFLCSPDAGFIRGVVLPVDGGRLHSI